MDKPPSPIAPTIVDPHRPSTAPTPPSDTTSLGARYEVLREIGSGGMGRVFQARDRETGEVLALKVLRPEVAAELHSQSFKNDYAWRTHYSKNVCRV
jgi:serine/threonine protein kinase